MSWFYQQFFRKVPEFYTFLVEMIEINEWHLLEKWTKWARGNLIQVDEFSFFFFWVVRSTWRSVSKNTAMIWHIYCNYGLRVPGSDNCRSHRRIAVRQRFEATDESAHVWGHRYKCVLRNMIQPNMKSIDRKKNPMMDEMFKILVSVCDKN